jgi:hypothetical protein
MNSALCEYISTDAQMMKMMADLTAPIRQNLPIDGITAIGTALAALWA